MPIFEYKCSDCGKISEFLVSGSGKIKLNCPDCGGSKLEKQFSVFSPQVKADESKKCHGCTDFKCPHSNK